MDNSGAQTIVAYIFAILPVAFAIVLTGLFGGVVSTFFPEMTFMNGFWAMNLFAGTGWLIYVIIVWFAFDEDMRTDYLGYLIPTVLVPGLFLLIPYMIFQPLSGSQTAIIPFIVVGGSILVMLWRHYQKLRFLKLSLKWYFIWLACLTLPAIGWLWYFENVKGWM